MAAIRPQSPLFVIQQYVSSRHDYYELRLEAEGVLKSWTVPTGPSTDPDQNRLAIPAEDRPMDYSRFEGIIPQGQPESGVVVLWDAGAYDNLTELAGEGGIVPVPVPRALEDGQLFFWLRGKKLEGGFTLRRTVSESQKEEWVLVKMRDSYAHTLDDPARNPHSIESGRTAAEIAEAAADAAGDASGDASGA